MQRAPIKSILLSVLILLSVIGIISINSFGAEEEVGQTARGTIYESIEEDHDVTSNENYTNKIVFLNGNLTIKSGWILELVNTTLKVNQTSSSDFVYSIIVEDGGTLKVTNGSVIQKNTGSNYELNFNFGSSGYLKDSTILYCGINSEQGLLIESDDVTILNCTLEDNYIGININSASPTIKDCEIDYSNFAAIRCNDSTLVLDNCIVQTKGSRTVQVENDSNLKLLSTSVPNQFIKVKDTSTAYKNWWLTVNVTDGAVAINNATVDVIDLHGNTVKSSKTDEEGEVKNVECTEFVQNLTLRNWSTDHTIKVSKDGFEPAESKVEINNDTFEEITLVPRAMNGNITGIVRDTEGFSIKNANVSVKLDAEKLWTLTDFLGKYTIFEVPSGVNYSMVVEAKINNITAYEVGKNNSVNVIANENTVVNFTLTKFDLPVSAKVESWLKWIDAEDAVDVNIGTGINISFTNPMDNATINNNNIKIKLGDTDIVGNIVPINEIEKPNQEYLFTPLINLEKEKTYTLFITTDVKRTGAEPDVFWDEYVISFDTEIDPVIDHEPEDSDINVDPVNPEIYVVFHNNIELNLLSLQDNFRLTTGTTQVDGTVSIADPPLTTRVIFKPTDILEGNTPYTFGLSDSLVDAFNERIIREPDQYKWSFTTGVAPIKRVAINGMVMDKDGTPIANANVALLTTEGIDIGSKVTDDNGSYTFSSVEVDKIYKIIISIKDFETMEIPNIILTPDEPYDVDNVVLTKEKVDDGEKEDKKEGAGIDPMMLGIIVLIIIIIIVILVFFMLSRRPKEEEVYEEEVEERVAASAQFGGIQTRAAPPMRMHSRLDMATSEGAPATKLSMNRCPMCGHRLNSMGECFRCTMAQRYGL